MKRPVRMTTAKAITRPTGIPPPPALPRAAERGGFALRPRLAMHRAYRGVSRFSMVQVVQFTINIFQELQAMSADDAKR